MQDSPSIMKLTQHRGTANIPFQYNRECPDTTFYSCFNVVGQLDNSKQKGPVLLNISITTLFTLCQSLCRDDYQNSVDCPLRTTKFHPRKCSIYHSHYSLVVTALPTSTTYLLEFQKSGTFYRHFYQISRPWLIHHFI